MCFFVVVRLHFLVLAYVLVCAFHRPCSCPSPGPVIVLVFVIGVMRILMLVLVLALGIFPCRDVRCVLVLTFISMLIVIIFASAIGLYAVIIGIVMNTISPAWPNSAS